MGGFERGGVIGRRKRTRSQEPTRCAFASVRQSLRHLVDALMVNRLAMLKRLGI